MKLDIYSEFISQKKPYVSPVTVVIAIDIEDTLATSNLEPIDGGDDPEIAW